MGYKDMSRTLDDMYNDLKLAKAETEPIKEMLINANNKEYKIRKEIERYKLDNGMYSPISDLLNHKKKVVDFIDLVELNEDGTLSIEYLWNDPTYNKRFIIDENGHVYYYDTAKTISYNEKLGKYIMQLLYNGKMTEHNYIGIFMVNFLDEEYKTSEELFKEIFGEDEK